MHNMTRVAERANHAPRRNSGSLGTDVARRSLTVVPPIPPVRRTTAGSLSGAARNSQGKHSEWTRSPYFANSVTIDSRWSK